VGKHRAGAATLDRDHALAVLGQVRTPDGVDTASLAVKPPVSHTASDLARAETEVEELLTSDHVLVAPGKGPRGFALRWKILCRYVALSLPAAEFAPLIRLLYAP
jgi:hypothetical protein